MANSSRRAPVPRPALIPAIATNVPEGENVKKLYLICLSAAMSGCSASNVNMHGPSTSLYAPINETLSTGEISYCNAGAKSVRDARREDAYKKMYEACGGKYAIVHEEDQNPAFCKMERRIWFKCSSDEKVTSDNTRQSPPR